SRRYRGVVPHPRSVVEADQVGRVPPVLPDPVRGPGLTSRPPRTGGSGIMRGEVFAMGRPDLTWIAVTVALLGAGLLPIASAAPRDVDRRLEPSRVSPLPSQVRRVEPAVVGIRVEVEPDRPSAATLGAERAGSGVIFDAEQGYVLTVSYLLLDAERIQVSLRDGRKVPARLTGLDLEAGIGVARLEGAGPWPAATLGDSRAV